MGKIIKSVKGIIMPDSTKDTAGEIFKDAVGALQKDPISAWSLIKNMKNLPSALRDSIFMECLQVFLLNSYPFDLDKQEFVGDNLISLAIVLADASPNQEAGYAGNPEVLREYAKRIVKLIDDCGTIQKAYYLACLTRALTSRAIDTKKYFKLCQCIRNLTEEDLLFLKSHISQNIITTDEDYIDDFRALGLLKDVDDGFAYTPRAFELKKYALNYEGNVIIPASFPERYKPITMEPISKEDIQNIVDASAEKITEDAVAMASPIWGHF